MADKGILTKEQEKELASLLDVKIKFDNKIIEAIDGTVFRAIISIVDDYGIDKLNENYKEQADLLADYLLTKDWPNAVVVVWELSSLIVKEFLSKK